MKQFSRFALPYFIWMAVLVLVPLLFMLILSFMYSQGFDLKDAKFSFDVIKSLFRPENRYYWEAFYNSMKFAFLATLICFLIGYPVSYILSRSKIQNKNFVLLILILPMWSNMLLRLYAIENLILPKSILNTIGISLNFHGTTTAIVVGLVLMYLPFMIFPIYTVLEKIDKSLLEASKDLGANDIKTFFKVTFPLSLKGVTSGVIMVFLPCAMGFVVPERLGGGKILLLGNIIEEKFKKTGDFNTGSLLSLIVIIIVLGTLFIISKVDAEGETLL
ncbi:MAG: ABC transporter permease [Acholeplasmataceae bacterium]|nr:ABC transporter permease [Acholeplasmataceae bacterium]HPT89558.1 ABC transporter permease [Bacilli bacterium]